MFDWYCDVERAFHQAMGLKYRPEKFDVKALFNKHVKGYDRLIKPGQIHNLNYEAILSKGVLRPTKKNDITAFTNPEIDTMTIALKD